MLSNAVCTDKGEGQDLGMNEGDDDGVLELAPHYQYISGLRSAHLRCTIGIQFRLVAANGVNQSFDRMCSLP